ncbi:MAG: ParB/RepB/Spo0J family partition protein [Conexibacter sp.]
MTNDLAALGVDVRAIPLGLIDEPALAMRETMDDERLASLAESIRELGQLQNLVVVAAGDRFRVAAGHRRRLALGLAGKSHAVCLVFPEGTPLEEAAKVAENTEREDVNPAAEATYYRWLLEHRAGLNVERLASIVNRKLSHVLNRLDLTRGDDAVLEALRAPSQRKPDSALARIFPDHDLTRLGQITLGVAEQLNKVKSDTYRALFLQDALRQGANASTVRRWREELQRTERVNASLFEQAANPTPASDASPIENIDACPFCLTTDDMHEAIYVRVHRSCIAVHKRQLLGSVRS